MRLIDEQLPFPNTDRNQIDVNVTGDVVIARASLIWFPHLILGFKKLIGSWKMIEILFLIISSILFFEINSFLKNIFPVWVSPLYLIKFKILNAVSDLPLPDSPIIPRILFSLISKETPLTKAVCLANILRSVTEIILELFKTIF